MHKARGKFVVRGGNQKFGGTCLDWGGEQVYPLMGMVPQSTHTPDIGQPWSNSLLDSRSFGQVGGGHRSFRQCPVVQFSQLPPIKGEVGGGGGQKFKNPNISSA